MPELLLAAKKFGSRSRHHISAWPQAKLAEFLKEHRERVSNGNGEVSAKMTFGEAAAIHLRNLDDNPRIKPSTRKYWRECLAALQKSWPGLNETEVRKITQADCKEWARAYGKTVSPTRYNGTISVLRHVLNVAVEAGVVYSNAAAAVKRAPVRCKEIKLPSIDKFNALIAEMRAGHSRDSINCADFASGLAFTGCRVSEAREIAWRDVDFDAGEIVVRGDANHRHKELGIAPCSADSRCACDCLNECGANVLANRWTQKYSASANARSRLIVRARKSAQIASRITICGTCSQRGASKAAWTFRPFPAGSDTKTAARWQ